MERWGTFVLFHNCTREENVEKFYTKNYCGGKEVGKGTSFYFQTKMVEHLVQDVK